MTRFFDPVHSEKYYFSSYKLKLEKIVAECHEKLKQNPEDISSLEKLENALHDLPKINKSLKELDTLTHRMRKPIDKQLEKVEKEYANRLKSGLSRSQVYLKKSSIGTDEKKVAQYNYHQVNNFCSHTTVAPTDRSAIIIGGEKNSINTGSQYSCYV